MRIIEPKIIEIDGKKFVGQRMKMSLVEDRTAQLWGGFMPRRKEIMNVLSSDLYSLQVYDSDYFKQFDPSREFEKWALMEVRDFSSVLPGMETFECPGGIYAVFFYKGSSTDASVFEYIFSRWLPSSSYQLDDRPHFEILGEKYKNGETSSEEEIWIPVRR